MAESWVKMMTLTIIISFCAGYFVTAAVNSFADSKKIKRNSDDDTVVDKLMHRQDAVDSYKLRHATQLLDDLLMEQGIAKKLKTVPLTDDIQDDKRLEILGWWEEKGYIVDGYKDHFDIYEKPEKYR